MGRPASLYTAQTARIDPTFESLHRTSSIGGGRVLKSQSGVGVYGAIAPRHYPEHPMGGDHNVFGPMPPAPRMLPSQEPICAFLTMEMQIAKANQGFGETIGVPSVVSRKLQDIVSDNDREKVFRLQRMFDEERREKDPTYLPPIYLKYEEDRAIQGVSFMAEEATTDREETITFQAPDGQQRTFRVRLGLAKKESTYFIVIVVVPMNPQPHQQQSAPLYHRETFSPHPTGRESQYMYQTQPQPTYSSPSQSSFMPGPPFDPRGDVTYRAQGSLGSNMLQDTNMPPTFAQPQPRQGYVPAPNPYEISRSDLSQGPSPVQPQPPPQQHRQRDLQLPPIRDQRGDGSAAEPMRQRDDRPRFDIGGLIERPDPAGRGGR
jgi:hypothetical protein